MKRVVIVQARMTSTRLPGKILAEVAGRPMLAQQLRRLARATAVDEVVVATTSLASDDPVVGLARQEGVRFYRGDEHDVLSRYLGAAREAKAELIVRITADCPLIDAGETDRVIVELTTRAGQADFAANVIRRTYPQGLDTESFFRDALERSARLGTSAAAREHVTWFMTRERPELFVLHSVTDAEDNSDLRWTVDTADDLAVVRKIYEGLGLGEEVRSYRDVLAWVRAHPEIARANAHVVQRHQ